MKTTNSKAVQSSRLTATQDWWPLRVATLVTSGKDGTTHLLTVELDKLCPYSQLNNQPISLRQEEGREAV